MEKGGLGSVRSVQERFAARQTELDEINRLLVLTKRALETASVTVTPEKAEAFAIAFHAQLCGKESLAFRRAYLRLMLDKVVVGKDSIRISGPKSVVAHQLTAEKPLPPSLVPTFVDGWRTGRVEPRSRRCLLRDLCERVKEFLRQASKPLGAVPRNQTAIVPSGHRPTGSA
jgi:hypothetical protein